MTEEENTVCLGSISRRVCEESNDYQPDEIDNENVPPHALKEHHSGTSFEETKFDQIPQTSEVSSRMFQSKKTFRFPIRTWLIFLSLSILTVFVMSFCCLILVLQFRQDTLDTFSVINRSIKNMKPGTTDSTAAFKSPLRSAEETHSQDEKWKENVLKIRSQIDEILIQYQRQLRNLTVLQNQLFEIRAEGYANLSTIKGKIRFQEAGWRKTWSEMKSRIDEIEIQDQSQIGNLTVLQNQVHEIQLERNTTMSTIKDEIQVREVKWRLYRHNLSEIRSQISKIHVQDQQQIGNLIVLQNQIRDIHFETTMNVSTIRHELHNHAEEWRRNFSNIRYHISDIRIQDQSQTGNITALQSQIYHMQAEINTTISTVKEEMRSKEEQRRRNLSTMKSRVNEILIQDQKLDKNLTALQNQIRELISDTNKSVSTMRDKIRGQDLECTQNLDRIKFQINEIRIQDQMQIRNLTLLQDQIQEIQNKTLRNVSDEINELKNKFNGLERLVLKVIYYQVRLELAHEETNETVSIIKAEIQENHALIIGLNRSISSVHTEIHVVHTLRKDLNKNINRSMEIQSRLHELNVILSVLDSQVEAIDSREINSSLHITDFQERIQSLHSDVGRIRSETNSLRTTAREQATSIEHIQVRLQMTSIRLVGGSGNSGRVEIFHGSVWGTICDDSWGISDANVACRMLGYRGASSAPGSARYGEGSGQIWLDEVSCSGTEISLEQCSKNSWGSHDCSHSEDASVICNT